jgi:DNA-binding NtrC family response regulator
MTSRNGAEMAWTPEPAATPAPESATVGAAAADITSDQTTATAPVRLPVDLPTMLREIENTYINAALAQTRSNKKEAAKLLGMGRTTLVEKLRRRSMAAARSSAEP